MSRIGTITRKTNETDIIAKITLDGTGKYNIKTGIGFFDHMLTQFAAHGCFDLELSAVGDLHIDPHHTIEDTAISLGKAIKEALGDKKGIFRVGTNFVPMDEALAFVSLDLSGRPFWTIDITWHGDYVGNSRESLIATSLIEHFFQTLAVHAGITLHIKVETGRDNHHIAEAVFKAFARALDQASRIDPKRAATLPSTKGTLGD